MMTFEWSLIMQSPLNVEQNGSVLEVTLNRPKANAIDAPTSKLMETYSPGFVMIRRCGWPSSQAAARNFSVPAGI